MAIHVKDVTSARACVLNHLVNIVPLIVFHGFLRVWLQDCPVGANFMMACAQVRDADRRSAGLGLGPKCHFFNSFFVNKLWKDAGAYCYANVARWTAQKKLEKQGQV